MLPRIKHTGPLRYTRIAMDLQLVDLVEFAFFCNKEAAVRVINRVKYSRDPGERPGERDGRDDIKDEAGNKNGAMLHRCIASQHYHYVIYRAERRAKFQRNSLGHSARTQVSLAPRRPRLRERVDAIAWFHWQSEEAELQLLLCPRTTTILSRYRGAGDRHLGQRSLNRPASLLCSLYASGSSGSLSLMIRVDFLEA